MKDQVVIITGGSSGIGKALAEVFGQQGAKIVITGRDREALQQTQQVLQQRGISVLALQGDVSKEADTQRMAEETVKHFGKIDVLINNAGISIRALFNELEISVNHKGMAINFFGAGNERMA